MVSTEVTSFGRGDLGVCPPLVVYISLSLSIYIYIYIQRVRERFIRIIIIIFNSRSSSSSISVYIYIYMYIGGFTEARERLIFDRRGVPPGVPTGTSTTGTSP